MKFDKAPAAPRLRNQADHDAYEVASGWWYAAGHIIPAVTPRGEVIGGWACIEAGPTGRWQWLDKPAS